MKPETVKYPAHYALCTECRTNMCGHSSGKCQACRLMTCACGTKYVANKGCVSCADCYRLSYHAKKRRERTKAMYVGDFL